MTAVLADAIRGLRARRGRTTLTAGVVLAAALVLGVVVTAAYSLSSGFDRAADRADLPSVLARFDDQDRATVDARVRALPNLAARSYRTEFTRVQLATGGNRLDQGVIQAVGSARRGYAIVAGRDLRARAGEAVIEAGLAREWKLKPGDSIQVGSLGAVRVVGVALAPDNVAYPLVRTARVYMSRPGLERQLGQRLPVNLALLWARDESRTDVLLSQARASVSGVRGLRFTTREGVRTLVESAAGLVIALLGAFALVASGLAGVLLAAGARSDVQRRLPAIGVRRAACGRLLPRRDCRVARPGGGARGGGPGGGGACGRRCARRRSGGRRARCAQRAGARCGHDRDPALRRMGRDGGARSADRRVAGLAGRAKRTGCTAATGGRATGWRRSGACVGPARWGRRLDRSQRPHASTRWPSFPGWRARRAGRATRHRTPVALRRARRGARRRGGRRDAAARARVAADGAAR